MPELSCTPGASGEGCGVDEAVVVGGVVPPWLFCGVPVDCEPFWLLG